MADYSVRYASHNGLTQRSHRKLQAKVSEPSRFATLPLGEAKRDASLTLPDSKIAMLTPAGCKPINTKAKEDRGRKTIGRRGKDEGDDSPIESSLLANRSSIPLVLEVVFSSGFTGTGALLQQLYKVIGRDHRCEEVVDAP
jgi:hypothetical protein